MRFPPEFIQRVKEQLSIASIVGEVVPLKRAGRNLKGLCPFHNEKSPSFTVHEEKQIYHCFGCGAGGDVIQFTMQRDGLSFPEAVERLASRAGLELPQEPSAADDSAARESARQRKLLLRVNQLAAEYFTQVRRSPAGAYAREYLAGRGFADDAQCTQLFLGAAEDGWDGLVRFLQSRNVPLELAAVVGLVRQRSSGGGFYDFFRRRVMFAIRNGKDEIIGFGGRVVEDSAAPERAADVAKYVNSSESPVFHKGDALYGLPDAQAAIRAADRVCVVEGYFDVLTLQQAGIGDAVAPLGTALTDAHVRWLARQTRQIVVCFDGDAAGHRAAMRALPLFLAQSLIPRVLELPAGDDPDTWIRREGAAAWNARCAAAPALFEWIIDRVAAQAERNTVGRVHTVNTLRPLFAQVRDPVQAALYRQRLAAAVGIPDAVLAQALAGDARALQPARPAPPPRSASAARPTQPQRRERLERALLAIVLASPQALGVVAQRMRAGDWRTETLQPIAAILLDRYAAQGQISWEAALAALPDPAIQRVMATLAFEAETYKDTADLAAVAGDLLQQLAVEEQREALQQTQQAIAALGADAADAPLAQLLAQTQQLLQRQHQR